MSHNSSLVNKPADQCEIATQGRGFYIQENITGNEIVWKDLPLFPHINLVVGLVILSGVLSICLDLLLAKTWSEYKPIFCEGWKHFRQRGN